MKMSQLEKYTIGAGKYQQEQMNQRHNNYINNPDICLFCGEKMPYARLHIRNKRKFCNKSCASHYNNKNRLYRKGLKKETNCIECAKSITIGKNASVKIAKCIDCKKNEKIKNAKLKTCKCCQLQFKDIKARLCCSKKCARKLQRLGAINGGKTSASKVMKRSKNEIYLYDLCKMYFLSVRHNEIIKDGWDADILIDDYQIAILWNGPWHYKQLPLSNHSLLQVQTRDKIKTTTLKSAGWKVFIFEDRMYTPVSAFNVLKEYVEVVLSN